MSNRNQVAIAICFCAIFAGCDLDRLERAKKSLTKADQCFESEVTPASMEIKFKQDLFKIDDLKDIGIDPIMLTEKGQRVRWSVPVFATYNNDDPLFVLQLVTVKGFIREAVIPKAMARIIAPTALGTYVEYLVKSKIDPVNMRSVPMSSPISGADSLTATPEELTGLFGRATKQVRAGINRDSTTFEFLAGSRGKPIAVLLLTRRRPHRLLEVDVLFDWYRLRITSDNVDVISLKDEFRGNADP